MIVRGAPMFVTRSAIERISLRMGVGHAVVVRRDFPMFVRVDPLRQGKQDESSQPDKA